MANNETLALAEAVRLTLAYCDAEVFSDPERFMTYLYDFTNNRSDEMRVLKNNCTAELLAPFKGADTMTTTDLKRAAAKVKEHLVGECQINAETSRVIARGLAEGVAAWRELTIDWDDRPQKDDETQRKAPAPKRLGKLLLGVVVLGFAISGIAAAVPRAASFLSNLPFVGGLVEEEEGVWLTTSRETKLADGTVSDAWVRTFDSHGNTLSSNDESLTDDGDTYTYTYTYGGYDSYGYPAWCRSNTTETEPGDKVSYQDRRSSDYTYETDARGRLKSKTETTESSSWFESSGWGDPSYDEETTTYSYDGNTIVKSESRSTYTSGDYSSETVWVSEYDSYGNQTRSSYRSSSDGEVYSTWDTVTSYKRRSDGTISSYKRTSTDTYDDKTKVTTTTVTCDKHGRSIEEKKTEDGTTTTTRYENEYDGNGNLVRRKNLTDGSVTTYKYVYIENPSFAVRHSGW